MVEMETTNCSFWLPKKNRCCSNTLLIGDSRFCGNHFPRVDEAWIQCPIDSSHSVLQENMKSHLKRCPSLKQTQFLSRQPYYCKGINSEDDDTVEVTSEMKRKYVHSMNLPEFRKLLLKFESLHSSLCGDISESFKAPIACTAWINGEIGRNVPFQEKHVMQQASILGNLEDCGVLTKGENQSYDSIGAVVEFGAGRGYLTQMITDSYAINRVVLIERKAYKLKADRSLRQREDLKLERLRIDIEDLNLKAVKSLQDVPYLALGKHLCGSATDLTLSCCLRTPTRENHIRGLAVATCCHHLCVWKHYINKGLMMELGVTQEEFHVLTWLTSWAVDGEHGSEAGNGYESPVDECGDVAGFVRSMKRGKRAVLGFKCKEIIDVGRNMWVKEKGLEGKLVKYVPESVSPENHLLVVSALKKVYG